MRVPARSLASVVPLLGLLAALGSARTGWADAVPGCHAVADAGGPYVAECDGPVVVIGLDGTRSPTCPGDHIEYEWTTDCPGASFDNPNSLTPRLSLAAPPPCPLLCRVVLTARNIDLGSRDSDDAPVQVDDTIAPIGAGAGSTVATLWPPNHRYVCLGAATLARAFHEACSGIDDFRITECKSSEPDDAPGQGDGATRDDCIVIASGREVCARAERAGNGPGRRYQLSGVARDGCGNAAAPVEIGAIVVLHDRH